MIEDIQSRLQNAVEKAQQHTDDAVRSEELRKFYEAQVCPVHNESMTVEIRAIGGFELNNVCCDEHFEKVKEDSMQMLKDQIKKSLKNF